MSKVMTTALVALLVVAPTSANVATRVKRNQIKATTAIQKRLLMEVYEQCKLESNYIFQSADVQKEIRDYCTDRAVLVVKQRESEGKE